MKRKRYGRLDTASATGCRNSGINPLRLSRRGRAIGRNPYEAVLLPPPGPVSRSRKIQTKLPLPWGEGWGEGTFSPLKPSEANCIPTGKIQNEVLPLLGERVGERGLSIPWLKPSEVTRFPIPTNQNEALPLPG